MANVLDVEGPAYRALSRWADLVKLSLIWWLLALPVITAPAAVGWLLHGIGQTRAGGRIPSLSETFGYLRRRFVSNLRLAGLLLGGALLVGIALLGPNPGGWYGQLVFVVGLVVGVCLALVAPWSFALADQHSTARATIRAAYRLAVRQLSLALLSAIAVVGGAATVLYAPAWMRLVAIAAVPGVAAALVSWLCDLAIARSRATRESSADTPSLDDHRLGEATS